MSEQTMTLLQAYLSNPRTRRVLSKKPGQAGFSLIELVVVIAVLAVLIVVALPRFQGVTDDAAASAGKKYLVDVYAECTVARARGLSVSVTAPAINGGAFTTIAQTACPVAAAAFVQTFTPALGTIPSFSIDLYSGAKTCNLRNNLPSYGCSAAGVW